MVNQPRETQYYGHSKGSFDDLFTIAEKVTWWTTSAKSVQSGCMFYIRVLTEQRTRTHYHCHACNTAHNTAKTWVKHVGLVLKQVV